ncbi:MAG: hypothetical protein JSR76_07455 [Verrucomicrobia bacterium]|nr:hypothetical protein [Verrucomicrobiota bacterium]
MSKITIVPIGFTSKGFQFNITTDSPNFNLVVEWTDEQSDSPILLLSDHDVSVNTKTVYGEKFDVTPSPGFYTLIFTLMNESDGFTTEVACDTSLDASGKTTLLSISDIDVENGSFISLGASPTGFAVTTISQKELTKRGKKSCN